MQIKYKDRSTIGHIGWCCCFFGFFVFSLVFGLSILPGLNEEWKWSPDVCFVVETRTCKGQRSQECEASVDVLFESAPVCDERVCNKRKGTVFPPPTVDSEVWVLIHDTNTSHTCWQRAETEEIAFENPKQVSTNEILLPFILSSIFCIPSCVFIPAFMKQDSSASRLLARFGFKHVPPPDAASLMESNARGKEMMQRATSEILMDNM